MGELDIFDLTRLLTAGSPPAPLAPDASVALPAPGGCLSINPETGFAYVFSVPRGPTSSRST